MYAGQPSFFLREISSANNMFLSKNKGDNQMKWYKKIGLLATTGLALFGLGACSNDGKSADGTVTIEYFNQKKK